jgi:hypothetical protein
MVHPPTGPSNTRVLTCRAVPHNAQRDDMAQAVPERRMPVGVAAGELPATLNLASKDERLRGRFVGEFRFAHGPRVWLQSPFDQ